MLARAPSTSRFLMRGVTALTVLVGAAAVHREAFSRTPPPDPRTDAPTGARTGAQAPTLSISLAAVGASTTNMKDECLTISAGFGAADECGDLRLVHALPST